MSSIQKKIIIKTKKQENKTYNQEKNKEIIFLAKNEKDDTKKN